MRSVIHFISIGPLRDESYLKDMVAIAATVDNPIKLVCLERDAKSYQEALKKLKCNAQVHTVESYLDQALLVDALKEDVEKIKKIKAKVLGEGRNKVLDRISFKELIAVFLLVFQGGYAMDTNIHPTSEKLKLPEGDQFSCPWSLDPEIWMLYAPEKNQTISAVFKAYLENWDKAQKPLSQWTGEDNYPYKYHLSMNNLLVDAIAKTLEQMHIELPEEWRYMFVRDTTVKLSGIDLEKTYGNSHKHPELLADRVLQYYMSREKTAETESDFSPEKLTELASTFKNQFVTDIKFNLSVLLMRYGRSPETQPLETLLKSEKTSYEDILIEIKKLSTLNANTTRLVLFSGIDPKKLFIKEMAKRLENNFESRTLAIKKIGEQTFNLTPP